MYETNGQLNAWWQRRLGATVLATEKAVIARLLPELKGQYTVLLGCSEQARLFSAGDVPAPYVLNKTLSAFSVHRGIRGAWDDLPIADKSLESLIVPHTLEMLDKDSRALFNEIFRVLKPEGDLIVFGFNPSIIWWLWQKCYPKDCPIPWRDRCRRRGDLRFSLSLLDYRFVAQKTLFYQLPQDKRKSLRWLNRVLSIFKKVCPWFGGVYVLHAKKQTAGLTPMQLSWAKKYTKVAVREQVASTRGAAAETAQVE